MSPSQPATDTLTLFAECLEKVPDPRSKQGTCHPCNTLLAIVLLGLLANVAHPCRNRTRDKTTLQKTCPTCFK